MLFQLGFDADVLKVIGSFLFVKKGTLQITFNLLALNLANSESTGTSRKFTASELALLDLDISDCPGVCLLSVSKT